MIKFWEERIEKYSSSIKLKQEMHEKQIFLKKDKQMKTYILDGILRRRRRSQGERQRDRGSRPLTMSGVWVINSRDSKAMRWLMIRVSSETKPQLYSKASPKIPLSLSLCFGICLHCSLFKVTWPSHEQRGRDLDGSTRITRMSLSPLLFLLISQGLRYS